MITVEVDEITQAIINGTAMGASDGWFKEECGTSSWVIENEKGAQCLHAKFQYRAIVCIGVRLEVYIV